MSIRGLNNRVFPCILPKMDIPQVLVTDFAPRCSAAERPIPLIARSGPQRSSSQGRAFYARRVISGRDPWRLRERRAGVRLKGFRDQGPLLRHVHVAISNGGLRHLLFTPPLFRVGAAWPRLGRAFRTAPVSRQTKPNSVWHSPRFHSRPATLLRPPFCSLSPFRLVSSRCRSSEERNKPETAEREKT